MGSSASTTNALSLRFRVKRGEIERRIGIGMEFVLCAWLFATASVFWLVVAFPPKPNRDGMNRDEEDDECFRLESFAEDSALAPSQLLIVSFSETVPRTCREDAQKADE